MSLFAHTSFPNRIQLFAGEPTEKPKRIFSHVHLHGRVADLETLKGCTKSLCRLLNGRSKIFAGVVDYEASISGRSLVLLPCLHMSAGLLCPGNIVPQPSSQSCSIL